MNLVIRAVTRPTTIPARSSTTSKETRFPTTYGKSTKGNGAEAKKSHEAIGEGDRLPDRHDPGKAVHHFVENLMGEVSTYELRIYHSDAIVDQRFSEDHVIKVRVHPDLGEEGEEGDQWSPLRIWRGRQQGRQPR